METSVREIAYSAEYEKQNSYISRRLRAKIGQDAHSILQNKTKGETEYYTKFYHKVDGWDVLIRGRADIVHKEGNDVIVEEIKSVTSGVENEANATHVLQLQLYAHYFKKIEKLSKVDAFLIIIDPINKKQRRIKVNTPDKTIFLTKHLRSLIRSYQEIYEKKEKDKERISTITFPHSEFRQFQEQIIKTISKTLKQEENLMLSAPPGIGKTISSFYPALRYIINNAMRLFVVTSKTTQQKIYRDTVVNMLNKGADFNSIVLTAKGKICHTDKYTCTDNDCPYLENYYSMDVDPIISDLLELKIIDREPVEQTAQVYSICPFELSLDVALQCDVMISDFNYIFHPQVRFQRFQSTYNDAILIVDEAHNLVTRSLEFYSDRITLKEIQRVITSINKSEIRSALKNKGNQILRRIYRHIQSLKDQIANFEYADYSIVEFDLDLLFKMQIQFDEFIIAYINDLPFELTKKDDIIFFSDKLKFFSLLLKETDNPEFEQIYDVDDSAMRVLCKSAAKKLEIQFKEFHSYIVQSATLHPFDYYISMLGLTTEIKILDLPSPFPEKNQLYVVDPTISTNYNDRDTYIDKTVQVILDGISHKTGNYLIFFPSFNYLHKILKEIKYKSSAYNILVQNRSMDDSKRQKLINQLRKSKNNLVFAVMGGIFSEGIDYIGDMAIGCFIIGPALPQFSFDQELRKHYFEEVYKQGFDYAYRNPGITKVIQSGGRIFRTETDKGFVVLIGRRFATEYYQDALPSYYNQIIVDDISKEIKKFWKK